MEANRRNSFRAVLAEPAEGTLVIGRHRFAIRINDESAGGLGVISESLPKLRDGETVRLITADGLTLSVRVTHCESSTGGGYRIGLERIGAYYRGLLLSDERRSVSAFRYAIALLGGLFVGHTLYPHILRHLF